MFLNINRHKEAQLLLEYVFLVAIAIIAIIAVNIVVSLRGEPNQPGVWKGFDKVFREIAPYAGAVIP